MLTTDDIRVRIRQHPFRPLRIMTSSGENYDVLHPDLIMFGKNEITVGLLGSESSKYYEQVARIAVMHITALNDLPMPPTPPGNGKA